MKFRSLLAAGAYMLPLLLAACGGGGGSGGGGPDPTGTLSGSVSFNPGAAEVRATLATHEASPFQPGQLIVGFRDSQALQAQSLTLSAASLSVQFARSLALPSGTAALYENPDLDDAALLKLADSLLDQPGIAWVQPNYIKQAQVVPNDPYYYLQWHYPAINLPQAWDLTTGAASTVVAVADTGILYSQSNPDWRHPDLRSNVLPGYDFITDLYMSNDGDGRDGDPFDPGRDLPNGTSSYHGTHVAGTIGASSNDGVGVAGVDWAARILPIRVLGRGGGTDLDIWEGAMWAAGLHIDGVPDNTTPAKVINLSLGGKGACTTFAQESINAILATGAIIVVAAGNDGADALLYSPASCAGVITVGATDFLSARAYYSNWGTRIDVMAPGGDTGVDWSGYGHNDGVLSLTFNDDLGIWDVAFQQGTSMAAPHVAGVISLMAALRPDVTAAEALRALTSTARPLSVEQCGGAGACGAGLIDAFAALQAIRALGPNPDPGPGPGPGPNPDPGPGPGPGPAVPSGPMIVGAFQNGPAGQLVSTGNQSGTAPFTTFSFTARAGTTWLAAWTDEDRDGKLSVGDFYFEYPFPIELNAGQTVGNLNLKLERIISIDSLELLDQNRSSQLQQLLPF